MRQSIGATWILQLVIVFMLIFVGFLALSINYTKAFKIKNELLSIVEKYEGLSTSENGSISIVNNYLRYNNYQAMSYCDEDTYGSDNLDSTTLTPTSKNTKYYYCVRKVMASAPSHANRVHYEITTFFRFNLPFIGDLFTFQVSGTTNDIENPSDDMEETLE